MESIINNVQYRMMQHALGIPSSNPGYRNRYIVCVTDSSARLWEDLQSKKLARCFGTTKDMALFRVTAAGARLVGLEESTINTMLSNGEMPE